MNLCLCLTYNNSLAIWNQNGTLARELEIYKKLIKDYKIHITVISYSQKNEDHLIPIHFRSNFKVIYNKYRLPNILYLISLFFLKSYFKDIDIFKSNQEHGALIGLLLSLIYSKKFIFRSGFSLKHHLFRKYGYFSIKFVYSYINNYLCCKFSDKIVLSSETFIKYYKVKNIEEKIRIIPNYFPYTIKKINYRGQKKEYEFLYIGRLSEEKNYSLVYKLAQKLSNKKFLVISRDIENYDINLKNIIFKKSIDNFKLSKYYAASKFLLLPSKYEGNSKVLIESMIYGTPVIANNGDGIRDIIEHLETGFLFKDIKELIFNYNKYNNDNNVIEKIINNAYRFATHKFALNKITKLEYEIYVNLKI